MAKEFPTKKMSDLGARELTSREGGGHTSWPADPLLRETIDLRSGHLNPLNKFFDVRTMKVFSFSGCMGRSIRSPDDHSFAVITELNHPNSLLYLANPFSY